MSEICLDCGTDITGPEVLCGECTKRYVRCQHGQVEHHCETCKAEARMAEAIRLLEDIRAGHAIDFNRIDAFLSANRGRE